MSNKITAGRFLRAMYPRAARIMGITAVAVGACAVLIDVITPIDLNVSIIYSLPLVVAGLTRSRRLLWVLLITLLGATFAVYNVQIGFDYHRLIDGASLFRNRVLVAMTMVLTAALLHAWMRALDAVDARDRTLEAQNRNLQNFQQQLQEQNDALERRRREAETASGRKTILFAAVSHDVRAPLAAIGLIAQAIGRSVNGLALVERIPALARQICVNSITVEQLVSDIVDFSTFELGNVELHPSDFAVAELIGQQCQSLLPLAEAKKLSLKIEPLADPIFIRTDRTKLGRVVMNLIMNSVKYTNAGSVWIEAGRSDGGGVWLRIRDSGIGIAADDLARIFDEFAQLQPQQSPRNQGWGLGLSICHRMVALMGGTIKVDSSPMVGSTFTVSLPPSCVVH
ncbi:MAG: sensor histidine kinase [Steroidobacteraceae bacterium]